MGDFVIECIRSAVVGPAPSDGADYFDLDDDLDDDGADGPCPDGAAAAADYFGLDDGRTRIRIRANRKTLRYWHRPDTVTCMPEGIQLNSTAWAQWMNSRRKKKTSEVSAATGRLANVFDSLMQRHGECANRAELGLEDGASSHRGYHANTTTDFKNRT